MSEQETGDSVVARFRESLVELSAHYVSAIAADPEEPAG